jgi:hypothetical protein
VRDPVACDRCPGPIPPAQYTAHVSGMPYSPEPYNIYEPATSAAGLAALHLNAVQRRMV